MTSTPTLSARLRPLILLGLAVGAVRYVLEFVAPDYSMYFGLYYVMPVALLVIGLRDDWGPIRWPALAGTMALTALILWGTWNSISYTTGQFLEWSHGRFHALEPDLRAAPIADSTGGKVFWGLLQGLLTSIAGSIWMTVLGTLLVWLPGRLRKRATSPADPSS